MSAYRIVLADDHVMFRKGIRNILERDAGLEVAGEAGDGLEVLKFIKNAPPDLVLLDIAMPGLRGLEATREIKIISPKVKVLILTMHRDKAYVYYAISAGAEGYLLKEDADTELFKAIEKIRAGDYYISPLLSGGLTHELIQAHHNGQFPPPESLTVRDCRSALYQRAHGRTSPCQYHAKAEHQKNRQPDKICHLRRLHVVHHLKSLLPQSLAHPLDCRFHPQCK
jgi:DNA-binding NarL/FixJ family response regulator